MTLIRITAPATYPVTVDEVKAQGRIIGTEEDTLIASHIAAATAHAEGITGRALVSQTWEEVLDAFPDGDLTITLGPISFVTSIKYLDADGAEQTLDPAEYVVDTASASGRIAPVEDWPVTKETLNAVRVRFVTGSGAPEDVKMAILMLAAHFHCNREAVGEPMSETPLGVQSLLGLHRRMFV
jgi:uncharacterized phiE125 gp8 family phage protein